MATSDGISTEDWEKVQEFAVDIANAPDDDGLRNNLLKWLEQLERKYGSLPSVLATRADYLDSEDPQREQLLIRAYSAAKSRADVHNLVHIAHSLAELYLERRCAADADQWLTALRQNLVALESAHYLKEYRRLRSEYRSLVIGEASNR
jgi:hypothetical protein